MALFGLSFSVGLVWRQSLRYYSFAEREKNVTAPFRTTLPAWKLETLTLGQISDSEGVRRIVSRDPNARNIADASERILDLSTDVGRYADRNAHAVVVYAPGRVELLGKHTDYAGGSSITCAVNHAFFFVAARTDEPGVRICDATGYKCEFLDYSDPFGSATRSWLAYPASVTERFVSNFGRPDHGVCIAFSSMIPRASGLSSSSAFVVGIYLALAALADVGQFPAYGENLKSARDLADYLGCVENGFSYRGLSGKRGVGTHGGSQDHTAILYSEQGKIGHYGYRPLKRLGTMSMPPGTCFVIGSSGVRASKAGGALGPYNHAVSLAKSGLEIWNRTMTTDFQTAGEMVASASFSLEKFGDVVRDAQWNTSDIMGFEDSHDKAGPGQLVYDRIEQFVIETQEIIPAAIRALRSGDLEQFGSTVDRSQDLTDRLLRNQVDETRLLARAARENGAIAASAFGAGFGGSVWALVPTSESRAFAGQWMAAYGRRFPGRLRAARFFFDTTGPGAFVIGASPCELLLEPKL